jgi:hypothetical protein
MADVTRCLVCQRPKKDFPVNYASGISVADQSTTKRYEALICSLKCRKAFEDWLLNIPKCDMETALIEKIKMGCIGNIDVYKEL